MKKQKNWRLALAMLAALTLGSCSSDDDDDFTTEQIQRTYFLMKDRYAGTMTVTEQGEAPRQSQTYTAMTAQSAEELTVAIPPEQVASQLSNETMVARIREVGFAKVKATYEFTNIDEGGAHFVLHPQMVYDEQLCLPATRTQPVTYQGLTLLFNHDRGGDFVKENGALDFTLCVGGVLIDNHYVDGFTPIVYHFSGMSTTKDMNGELEKK